jgi:hypothetical protein
MTHGLPLSEAQGCKAAFTTAGSSLPWDDAVCGFSGHLFLNKMMDLGTSKSTSKGVHVLQLLIWVWINTY